MAMTFPNIVPKIILDLIYVISGQSYSLREPYIEEEEEESPLSKFRPRQTQLFSDVVLADLKNQIIASDYSLFCNAFMRLSGIDVENRHQMMAFKEQSSFVLEQDIIENFSKVFGYDHPFFAKLVYLYLSNGHDRSKISLARFIGHFQVLANKDALV